MNLRAILPAVGLGCCLVAPACVTFPKRVPVNLTMPQPRDAFVTPGTDATDMIAWQKPALPIPVPPIALNSSDSISRCGGALGTLLSEYRDVHGKQLQLIHGKAAASEFSGHDFGGTHRYKDWNILMVVEPGDENTFLATANSFFQGGWVDDDLAHTLAVYNPDLDKLIELEWDTGFFAPEMAPGARDETLAVGRWILDCGHESLSKDDPPRSLGFRAEVHAPAIVLSGHIIHSDPTGVQAEFKAFAASRSGPMDAVPVIFFITKFFASHVTPLGGHDYSVNLHAPGDGWKIASCTTREGSGAGGRAHRIRAQVKSEDGGKSLTLTLPVQSLKPTASIESSTIVDLSWVRGDSSSSGGITQCESAPANR